MNIVITIDTEADNLWQPGKSMATRNIDFVPRFQELCNRYEFKPTYLCSHAVAVCRNKAVARMFGMKATHLFFVDNDTLIPPTALRSLLSLGVPIATGCTPTIPHHETGKPHLNVALTAINGVPQWETEWFNGVSHVRYCGASCLLVEMGVFENIGFPWFRQGEYWDGSKYLYRSEDLEFCDQVYQSGYTIVADGSVRTQHPCKIDAGTLIEEAVHDRV